MPPCNETHFKSASFGNVLHKAIGELDQTKAQDYWNQVQQIQYDHGGYLLGEPDIVDAVVEEGGGHRSRTPPAARNYLFRTRGSRRDPAEVA